MWESKYKFLSEGQAPGLWDKWEEAQDRNDLSTYTENRNVEIQAVQTKRVWPQHFPLPQLFQETGKAGVEGLRSITQQTAVQDAETREINSVNREVFCL